MAYYTSDYLVEYHDGVSYVAIADAYVLDVAGESAMAQADNGAGFGDEALTRCKIDLQLAPFLSLDLARLPVRVTFQINAGTQVAFVGEVASASGDLDTVSLDCESMLAALSGRTRDYYSPLRYRRPPATKTTASSIEDPSSLSYAGGLINELLWSAGGRPAEQAGSYAGAVFYYSCEQAIRAPDWSWVAGENGYEEAKRLARAVGGQLRQGLDGVVYYVQPLTMIGSVAQTYTRDDFRELTWSLMARDQYARSFQISYTPRRALNVQEVILDTTYRTIPANESLTIDLEPRYPIVEDTWVLDAGTLKDKNLVVTFFDGAAASYHATLGYTVTVATYAMRLTIVLTNHTSRHMQLSKVMVDAQPVAPSEVETLQVGTDEPVRVIEENPFIQSKAHALALATMMLSFYSVARRVFSLREMVYNTSRDIGDTVALTVPELSLTAATCIIMAKRHSETGVLQEVDLLEAAGLPELADYWLVKSTSQSGTKKIAW